MTYKGTIKLGLPNQEDEIHFNHNELDHYLDIALRGHYESAELRYHPIHDKTLEKNF